MSTTFENVTDVRKFVESLTDTEIDRVITGATRYPHLPQDVQNAIWSMAFDVENERA